jgi:hypothetical protein
MEEPLVFFYLRYIAVRVIEACASSNASAGYCGFCHMSFYEIGRGSETQPLLAVVFLCSNSNTTLLTSRCRLGGHVHHRYLLIRSLRTELGKAGKHVPEPQCQLRYASLVHTMYRFLESPPRSACARSVSPSAYDRVDVPRGTRYENISPQPGF